jgi:hypothetical protein
MIIVSIVIIIIVIIIIPIIIIITSSIVVTIIIFVPARPSPGAKPRTFGRELAVPRDVRELVVAVAVLLRARLKVRHCRLSECAISCSKKLVVSLGERACLLARCVGSQRAGPLRYYLARNRTRKT